MKIDLSPRTDPKYVGWALARGARDNPGVSVEFGALAARAIFDAASHTFTLRVDGHPAVRAIATGPRSTRIVGAPPPTRYDAFWYLVEGFTALAFDATAPNQAFTDHK